MQLSKSGRGDGERAGVEALKATRRRWGAFGATKCCRNQRRDWGWRHAQGAERAGNERRGREGTRKEEGEGGWRQKTESEAGPASCPEREGREGGRVGVRQQRARERKAAEPWSWSGGGIALNCEHSWGGRYATVEAEKDDESKECSRRRSGRREREEGGRRGDGGHDAHSSKRRGAQCGRRREAGGGSAGKRHVPSGHTTPAHMRRTTSPVRRWMCAPKRAGLLSSAHTGLGSQALRPPSALIFSAPSPFLPAPPSFSGRRAYRGLSLPSHWVSTMVAGACKSGPWACRLELQVTPRLHRGLCAHAY